MSFGVDEKIFEGKVELPSCAYTHGAKFHSDDVFATAFLQMIKPDIQITAFQPYISQKPTVEPMKHSEGTGCFVLK